jgi:hypothetical protein
MFYFLDILAEKTEKMFKKESEKMNIKVNRKSPMTDVGQRAAMAKLIREAAKTIHSPYIVDYTGFINKAMEICKNDPQEIESIEVTIPFMQAHIDPFPGIAFVTLTYDQYKQIKAAVEE